MNIDYETIFLSTSEHFLIDIDYYTTMHKTIALFYFIITSLTTIGLGDLTPLNEGEQLFMVVILALGVGLFSYIMNELKETLGLLDTIDADLDDYDNLNRFVDCME